MKNTGLKLNIQKRKIMASAPITSWQIDGETMETIQTLFSWAPESPQMVTATMKLKTFSPWRQSCEQPWQQIKKQRHYFPDKDLYSQSYGFSSSYVWMWELDHKEGWALRNWCFWTVELEKTLESPQDYKEIQPVIPKEISPEYSLERLMLNLKLQYFGHLMWRAHTLERTLVLGKIEGRRRRGQQRMRWFDDITDSMHMRTISRRLWRTGKPGILQSMGLDMTEQLNTTNVEVIDNTHTSVT